MRALIKNAIIMKIAGILLLVIGSMLFGACESEDGDTMFNHERHVLERELQKERLLRLSLQAYIDSMLIKDDMSVEYRLKHYAESLYGDKMKPIPGGTSTKKTVVIPDSSTKVLTRKLKTSFAKQLNAGWKITTSKNAICLSLEERAIFAENQAILSEKGIADLQAFALKVQNHAQLSLIVEGHTDSLSHSSGDHGLYAWRRAKAVGDVLQKAGFPQKNISIASHGATAPLATNATEAGRYLNRRTLLILNLK